MGLVAFGYGGGDDPLTKLSREVRENQSPSIAVIQAAPLSGKTFMVQRLHEQLGLGAITPPDMSPAALRDPANRKRISIDREAVEFDGHTRSNRTLRAQTSGVLWIASNDSRDAPSDLDTAEALFGADADYGQLLTLGHLKAVSELPKPELKSLLAGGLQTLLVEIAGKYLPGMDAKSLNTQLGSLAGAVGSMALGTLAPGLLVVDVLLSTIVDYVARALHGKYTEGRAAAELRKDLARVRAFMDRAAEVDAAAAVAEGRDPVWALPTVATHVPDPVDLLAESLSLVAGMRPDGHAAPAPLLVQVIDDARAAAPAAVRLARRLVERSVPALLVIVRRPGGPQYAGAAADGNKLDDLLSDHAAITTRLQPPLLNARDRYAMLEHLLGREPTPDEAVALDEFESPGEVVEFAHLLQHDKGAQTQWLVSRVSERCEDHAARNYLTVDEHPTRDGLHVAALRGRVFESEIIKETLGGDPEDVLQEALSTSADELNLIVGRGNKWRFTDRWLVEAFRGSGLIKGHDFRDASGQPIPHAEVLLNVLRHAIDAWEREQQTCRLADAWAAVDRIQPELRDRFPYTRETFNAVMAAADGIDRLAEQQDRRERDALVGLSRDLRHEQFRAGWSRSDAHRAVSADLAGRAERLAVATLGVARADGRVAGLLLDEITAHEETLTSTFGASLPQDRRLRDAVSALRVGAHLLSARTLTAEPWSITGPSGQLDEVMVAGRAMSRWLHDAARTLQRSELLAAAFQHSEELLQGRDGPLLATISDVVIARSGLDGLREDLGLARRDGYEGDTHEHDSRRATVLLLPEEVHDRSPWVKGACAVDDTPHLGRWLLNARHQPLERRRRGLGFVQPRIHPDKLDLDPPPTPAELVPVVRATTADAAMIGADHRPDRSLLETPLAVHLSAGPEDPALLESDWPISGAAPDLRRTTGPAQTALEVGLGVLTAALVSAVPTAGQDVLPRSRWLPRVAGWLAMADRLDAMLPVLDRFAAAADSQGAKDFVASGLFAHAQHRIGSELSEESAFAGSILEELGLATTQTSSSAHPDEILKQFVTELEALSTAIQAPTRQHDLSLLEDGMPQGFRQACYRQQILAHSIGHLARQFVDARRPGGIDRAASRAAAWVAWRHHGGKPPRIIRRSVARHAKLGDLEAAARFDVESFPYGERACRVLPSQKSTALRAIAAARAHLHAAPDQVEEMWLMLADSLDDAEGAAIAIATVRPNVTNHPLVLSPTLLADLGWQEVLLELERAPQSPDIRELELARLVDATGA